MHPLTNQYLHLAELPIMELINKANTLREEHNKDEIDLCSIVNAKSGKCSEDCKYCAQSSFYNTNINEYQLLSQEELIKKASECVDIGTDRFSFVTSGHGPTQKDIDTLADVSLKIKEKFPNLKLCASLGILSDNSLKKLKDAGIGRYHHNIETSEDFYPKIVSTHTYKNRIDTVKQAKALGFEICCGGIFGLGESWTDRISMALEIKDLDIDSIPLNFLMPIKGTPLEDNKKLSTDEVLRIIAIFKIINPTKVIRIVAGRENYLKDSQTLAFLSGANSMMIGGYLTVGGGRTYEDDQQLLSTVKSLWKQN